MFEITFVYLQVEDIKKIKLDWMGKANKRLRTTNMQLMGTRSKNYYF